MLYVITLIILNFGCSFCTVVSHRSASTNSGYRFISVNCFFFIERWRCPVYLLLLRGASLFRHSGVCSLQSVPETPNEAVSYRTEKGNTRTGLRCWLWPDERKRTDLHLSGNVQPHAGTVEGMRASSPFDIRVIRMNTQIFCSFCMSNNYVLCSVTSAKEWNSELSKKHNFIPINFQYLICYGLLCPFISTICEYVAAKSIYIKRAL
jgi:hypothetical protein